MYDHLSGEVHRVQPARVVLLVAGIGYELEVPTGTSSALSVGQHARLYTILHVVDGVPTLLGFHERSERDLARRLLSVSGIGKAMSLAILSTYSPGEVAGAILRGDHPAMQRVKGIGAKTAERLCLELRDAIAKLDLTTTESVAPTLPDSAEDAIAGLVTLGYSEKEARKKVGSAWQRLPDAPTEDLIKSVLRG